MFKHKCYNKNEVGGFMTLLMKAFVILLNGIYVFFKLFKVQRKIVFISRQTNNPSLDFRMLKKEIEEKDSTIKIVFVTKKTGKDIKDNIKNIKNIFIQMYHLATSKMCITDGYNITISVLKHKKELKIIQIWHALGAIKKFGHQSLTSDKQKIVAKVMKMHNNYDYIISGSKAMTKYFAKAFNYEENKFVPLGLPRLDYLATHTQINRKKIYQQYPKFRNKKIILYTPTFRNNHNYKINELIDAVDLKKYVLIIKIHPNMKIDNINKKDNIYTCDEFTSLQLLSIANYVITDYSAISIEAAVLEKPVFIYAYDYDEYSKKPGININLKKELSGFVYVNEKELMESLSKKKYNMEVLKKFKQKYVCNSKGTVTKDLCDFILEKGGFNEKVKN